MFSFIYEIWSTGGHFLQHLCIGHHSFFSNIEDDYHPLYSRGKHRIITQRKSFMISDCSQLQEIRIGPQSFVEFVSCQISNLPQLKSCVIGVASALSNEMSSSFCWCKSVCIQDLPSLVSLDFGNYSFFFCYYCLISCEFFLFIHSFIHSFIGCHQLQSLRMGYCSFANYEGKDGSLYLLSLPNLQSLVIENEALFNCSTLNLKELTSLQSANQVALGPQSFYLLKKIRCSDVDESVLSLFHKRRNYHPSIIRV